MKIACNKIKLAASLEGSREAQLFQHATCQQLVILFLSTSHSHLMQANIQQLPASLTEVSECEVSPVTCYSSGSSYGQAQQLMAVNKLLSWNKHVQYFST